MFFSFYEKKLLEILEEKRFSMFKNFLFYFFDKNKAFRNAFKCLYTTAHIFYKKVFFNFVVKCI
jgi:hypothetical protein